VGCRPQGAEIALTARRPRPVRRFPVSMARPAVTGHSASRAF
jgi:hypothetical protein